MPRGTRLINLLGQPPFGRLTVLEWIPKNPPEPGRWLCLCTCGQFTKVAGYHLRAGHTRSCGCGTLEFAIESLTTHGMTDSPEYSVWAGMKNRCYNTNEPRYIYYGQRGIQVCTRWRDDFIAFFQAVGARPTPRHRIDRINNDGHYSCGQCPECLARGWPMNVRWATLKEQMNNMRTNHRISIGDMTKTAQEWADSLHVHHSTIRRHIYKYKDIESFIIKKLVQNQ